MNGFDPPATAEAGFDFTPDQVKPGPAAATAPGVVNQPGITKGVNGRPPENLGDLVAPPIGTPATPGGNAQTKLPSLVLPPDATHTMGAEPDFNIEPVKPKAAPQPKPPAAPPLPGAAAEAPAAAAPAGTGRITLPRMPHDFEVMALPDGAVVDTPIGTLVKRGGKAEVTLSAAGHAAYRTAIAKAVQDFGPHPFSGDPAAPEAPVVLGKRNFNPMSGRWSGEKKAS